MPRRFELTVLSRFLMENYQKQLTGTLIHLNRNLTELNYNLRNLRVHTLKFTCEYCNANFATP